MTKRVLIVEDSAPGAHLWCELVNLAGGTAEVARTGADALAAAAARPPALVVMDLHLPDGNGVDWTRRLRGLIGDAPAWACSGLDAHEMLDGAWDDPPFAAFIAKPFVAAEVLARLKTALA